MTLREILQTLWRRKLTIVVSVVVAVVAALAYSKLQTPKYQSTALIQISSPSGTTGQTSSPVTFPDPLQELNSTAVQAEAARLLSEPNVSAVASAVTGTVDTTTGALSITATDSDPARAQQVAKAYSTAYIDQIQVIAQGQIDKITTVMSGLSSKIATLSLQPGAATNPSITSQVTALQQTYNTLQAEQYNIQVGEPYASVQVAAGYPTASNGLSTKKLVGIGVLVGLLVGCGIALVRDQFDTRLRTSPDVEAVTEAPVLAELPEDGDVRAGKIQVAMVQAPQSLLAESFRELRTSLRVILDDTPCPVIVVTSPEAGDGKTFVTANLAAALALSGGNVVVVSGDFRRPRLEEILDRQSTGFPGFADLIRASWKEPEADTRPVAPREDPAAGPTGERRPPVVAAPGPARGRRDAAPLADGVSISSMLVDTDINGLRLLPAGTALDNPAELFGSPGLQPVIEQLPLVADIVLVDTPPVLAVPDTAILGSRAHGAIVVATEGRTDRESLERTIHRLETTHCTVIGLVLNRVRRSSGDAYQSYSYKQ